eukprot:1290877-Amphidinium_carterae.1
MATAMPIAGCNLWESQELRKSLQPHILEDGIVGWGYKTDSSKRAPKPGEVAPKMQNGVTTH